LAVSVSHELCHDPALVEVAERELGQRGVIEHNRRVGERRPVRKHAPGGIDEAAAFVGVAELEDDAR
jgi:hypothetical protein